MNNVTSLDDVIMDRFEVINTVVLNYGDFNIEHMGEDWFPTTLATIRGHQGRLLYAYITPGKDYSVFTGEEDQPNLKVARLECRGIRAAIRKAGLVSTGSWTNSLQRERGSVTYRPLDAPPRIKF